MLRLLVHRARCLVWRVAAPPRRPVRQGAVARGVQLLLLPVIFNRGLLPPWWRVLLRRPADLAVPPRCITCAGYSSPRVCPRSAGNTGTAARGTIKVTKGVVQKVLTNVWVSDSLWPPDILAWPESRVVLGPVR